MANLNKYREIWALMRVRIRIRLKFDIKFSTYNLIFQLKGWNAFNVLQKNASTVGIQDVGITNNVDDVIASKPKVLFLLGADDNKITRENLPSDCVVIYQGHHGDVGATIADIVLPGSAYTEKQGTYLNAEGRAQQTLTAVTAPGMARDDWKIIRAISEVVGQPLPYDTLDDIRYHLEKIAPHLTNYGRREGTSLESLPASVSTLTISASIAYSFLY